MFIQAFNPSELTTVISIQTKRIDDYYSESFSDYLYANFFPLHKDKLEAVYVGDEDSRFGEVADVIRCEMYLNKVSSVAVGAIHADLRKITEDWLVTVGGYEEVKP
jgi:hypothetical protein